MSETTQAPYTIGIDLGTTHCALSWVDVSASDGEKIAQLDARLGINELAELAASVSLAGSHGARIRASLAAKADTLRGHQVAETEAAAEAATDRMTVPVAVLLFGFLVFIAYPAVVQITSVSGPQP